jgi:D,D-heptose 1,7-bisphosphate phosphatase
MNRAVFLDRDGTIARDVHYCRRVEDFELLPTVPQAIRLLNENGFKVVVITNQSGLARGYFTEETLEQIHQKMKSELAKHNAWVDAIYYCPHHPDDGCDCRKPKTALFLRAAAELDIDFSRSYVVGDMQMDIDAGKALGCRTILVSNDPLCPIPNPQSPVPKSESPNHIADNLLRVAERIVSDPPVTITVIVPTRNEGKNLSHVLPKIPPVVGEILLVDGHSTDDTVTMAKRLSQEIRVTYQDGKGKGNALRYGIAEATGDIIVTLDADGSMDPEEIPTFIAPLLAGYDYVKGSRFLPGGGTLDMPWLRRLGNKLFTVLVNLLHGTRYTDLCYGYNAFWKKTFQQVRLNSDGFEIETEMHIKAAKARLKVTEVPSFERARLEGSGNLRTFKDGWKIFRTILLERVRG